MAVEPYVAEMFERIGPIADLYAVDAYENEGLWHIAVDADARLIAEWAAERRLVVLSADLGVPRVEDRSRLLELALQVNGGWTESGGLRLALDGAGALTLLLDWAPTIGAERELAATLHRFAGAALAWREILQGTRIAATDAFGSFDFQMIRV